MMTNCSGSGHNFAADPKKDPALQIPLGPMPDMAMHIVATGFNLKVLCGFALPSHTVQTKEPMSVAAPLPGMATNMIMSQCMHIKGSLSVFFGNMPATRMLDPTMQNGMNMSGTSMTPSQTKVFILK